jgi:hypothetical protein
LLAWLLAIALKVQYMAAFACTQCGHVNPHGALFCEECFTLLLETKPDPRRTTLSLEAVSQDGPIVAGRLRKLGRTAHIGKLDRRSVALYIGSRDEPLIVALVNQVLLGRATLSANQTLVDLSAFGARNSGVSRQHCSLKRGTIGVTAQDLGSSNGTWLDEVRLEPYRPALIVSGALLRLGQLELEIYLPE